MPRNHRCRFASNNYVNNLSSSRYTYSSQLSSFPFTNTQSDLRSKVWKPSGYFEIDSTNNKIYINDGSDKTITLTSSSTAYTTPALLATHIQTQLNASSSSWTVSYSTSTYKFTIAHTGSATLRLSQTSNAAWSTIGYTTSTDLVGTSFTADQQRNHTSEFILFDFQSSVPVTFFACIGPINEVFSISSSATIKIQANNINSWTAPPIDETLSVSNGGIFEFLDDLADTAYRYWKFSFVDKLNPSGPEGFKFSHIYLGDYITYSARDIGHGYVKAIEDPTVVTQSESGTMYFDVKTKYSTFSGLSLQILERDDKDQLERLYWEVGRSVPFYFSIDPTLTYTDTIDELTKFVYFVDAPRFTHTMRDMFSTQLNLKEVV